MKNFFRAIGLLGLCAIIFVSCGGKRSFNVNVLGVDQIHIEGAKAVASLSKASTRAGGNGETLLYAIDEFDNVVLPKISCNFDFGDDVTPEEREMLIKDMNATISTFGINDFGPYIVVKYSLSYTSSYIVHGGKGEASVSLGWVYSAIRKSDGKSFTMTSDTPGTLHILDDILSRFSLILRKVVRVSDTELCVIYGDHWSSYVVKISEQGKMINISISADSIPNIDVVKDCNGNVYSFWADELVTYGDNVSLGNGFRSVAQIGNQVYAFLLVDSVMKVYQVQDNAITLYDEITENGEYMLDNYAGTINGEALFLSNGCFVKYNPVNRGSFNVKELGGETNELIYAGMSHGETLLMNGVAFCTVWDAHKVEVVKINLFDESKEIIPIAIPGGKEVVGISYEGSAESNYLKLNVYCATDETLVYNIQGFHYLPDLSGYEVHKVIPLK